MMFLIPPVCKQMDVFHTEEGDSKEDMKLFPQGIYDWGQHLYIGILGQKKEKKH